MAKTFRKLSGTSNGTSANARAHEGKTSSYETLALKKRISLILRSFFAFALVFGLVPSLAMGEIFDDQSKNEADLATFADDPTLSVPSTSSANAPGILPDAASMETGYGLPEDSLASSTAPSVDLNPDASSSDRGGFFPLEDDQVVSDVYEEGIGTSNSRVGANFESDTIRNDVPEVGSVGSSSSESGSGSGAPTNPIYVDPNLDPDEEGNEHWHLSYNFIVRDEDSENKDMITTRTLHTDLSDTLHDERTNFTVTVQINYKNTSQVMDYNPGELKLVVPNLFYGKEYWVYTANKKDSMPTYCSLDYQIQMNNILFGVDTDESTNSYSWHLDNQGTNYMSMKEFTFVNDRVVKADENFEGAIQIVYSMDSLPENFSETSTIDPFAEFTDFCLHEFSEQTRVTLQTFSEDIKSNVINYSYTRPYEHVWPEAKYNIKKTAETVSSPDGFQDHPDIGNMDDFYWVRWRFDVSVPKNRLQPREAVTIAIEDEFPEGVIVFDSEGNRLERTQFDGKSTYVLMNLTPPKVPNGYSDIDFDSVTFYVVAAYPMSMFEGKPLHIQNTASVYALMKGREDEGYLWHDSSSADINLGKFLFQWPPGNYGIEKMETSEDTKYFQAITGSDAGLNDAFTYNLYPQVEYTDFPMEVQIGDDMLYITDTTGNYRRLSDNEYYFSQISFPAQLYNGNGFLIANSYEYDLYVRSAGSADKGFDSYAKVGSGVYSPGNGKTFSFSKQDAVVGYYFQIHEVEESLGGKLTGISGSSGTSNKNFATGGNCTIFKNEITITSAVKANTRGTGSIYNFCWICVLDQKGDLKNPANEGNYSDYGTSLSRKVLVDEDMSNYDHLLRRAADYNDYETFTSPSPGYILWAAKTMSIKAFDNELGGWPGSATLNLKQVCKKINDSQLAYVSNIPDEKRIVGYDYVDLLPDYVTVTSTPEEIIDSFHLVNELSGIKYFLYQDDGTVRQINNSEFVTLVKENTTVEFTEVDDSPIMRIIVDLNESPVTISGFWPGGASASVDMEMNFDFDYIYNYEGYLSDKIDGQTIKNRYFGYFHDRIGTFAYGYYNTFNFVYANGYVSSEEKYGNVDINGNGINNENMVFGDATAKVNLQNSAYMNIIKEVADYDDEQQWTTGHVDVNYEDPYRYRLNMVTGNNGLTNVVLYDLIEDYAKDPEGNIVVASGKKDSWDGVLEGIDLKTDPNSPENKKYPVQVYYSKYDKPDHALYVKRDDNGEIVDAMSGAEEGAYFNEDEWHLYTEGETPNEDVISLAFDFKDLNTGDYAKIKEWEKVSIILDMKAPSKPGENEEIYSYAYNGFWSRWKAIGSVFDNDTIPGTEGINSNIVTVALPGSGKSNADVDIWKSQAFVVDDRGNTTEPTKDLVEVDEGDILRYFVTVKNTGSTIARDLTVIDAVPLGLEVVPDSISDNGFRSGRVITWTFESLAAGEERTVSFDVVIPKVTTDTRWSNFASVYFDDDDDPENERQHKRSNTVDAEHTFDLTFTKGFEGNLGNGQSLSEFEFKATFTWESSLEGDAPELPEIPEIKESGEGDDSGETEAAKLPGYQDKSNSNGSESNFFATIASLFTPAATMDDELEGDIKRPLEEGVYCEWYDVDGSLIEATMRDWDSELKEVDGKLVGTITYKLAPKQTMKFTNLYEGTIYSIEEIGQQGFTQASSDNLEGAIEGDTSAEIVNKSTEETPELTIRKTHAVYEDADAQHPYKDHTEESTSVKAGDVVEYRITITNPSDVPVTHPVITDTVPESLAIVEGSISDGGVMDENRLITWSFPKLEPHASISVSYKVRIPDSIENERSWNNIASTKGDEVPDPEDSNEVIEYAKALLINKQLSNVAPGEDDTMFNFQVDLDLKVDSKSMLPPEGVDYVRYTGVNDTTATKEHADWLDGLDIPNRKEGAVKVAMRATESIVITNLPEDTGYAVSEVDIPDDYELVESTDSSTDGGIGNEAEIGEGAETRFTNAIKIPKETPEDPDDPGDDPEDPDDPDDPDEPGVEPDDPGDDPENPEDPDDPGEPSYPDDNLQIPNEPGDNTDSGKPDGKHVKPVVQENDKAVPTSGSTTSQQTASAKKGLTQSGDPNASALYSLIALGLTGVLVNVAFKLHMFRRKIEE